MPLTEFHPTVRRWFETQFGQPTAAQRLGWPLIGSGAHALIAAPTGTGKTLAGFLWAINTLVRQGPELTDHTQVLYLSPLKALGNDVQKNLSGPLAAMRALDGDLPEVRVRVRTGDTPQRERAAMGRQPPHILVTTPESLYILLTSAGGRELLRQVRTTIVDEIHAVVSDKRGAHLALSLERLAAHAGEFQRIGLSATQRPMQQVAAFLAGAGRDCQIVDVGHRRAMDIAVEIPDTPLSAVCAHEQWNEIYQRMAALIQEHRTTLVFVNTRKLAERLAARLSDPLGENAVTCHHSSLSRERRLDAEQRLKSGALRALVATASLELGIDIGEVDLVIQLGSTRSIATALQRIGRSGHALGQVPKGRLFPLTLDEAVEAAALLRAIERGDLDQLRPPVAALDILAQQVIAACVTDTWAEQDLFECCRRAGPYTRVSRADFDAVAALHTQGRRGLLHRDGIGNRLRARRAARLVALTCGGAIPDTADYPVVADPEGITVGTLNEDFAIESNVGDIFQLGNTSWRVLKVERGRVRVADAHGQPPSIPFWFGEAPSRTRELSAEVGVVREIGHDAAALMRIGGLGGGVATQIADYLNEGRAALGALPTQRRVVLERFFDESGGMQLIVHAPFGGRINRAWGLALRKRFCRGFGFELQAAANEEAIIISLGPHHSFPLEDVFRFLHPDSARDVLTQAILTVPIFEARWRWNVGRALLVPRMQGGRKVPPAIRRMRADDLLAAAFPDVLACPENLPAGSLEIPPDHPLVRQTIEDCLTEALDVDGFLEVLRGLADGSIETLAVDTPEPSAFARGILAAQPYSFLDDAPLEERRTQAVMTRRTLDTRTLDELGELDAIAVQRVRQEAWPDPGDAEEVHEALLWMGYVTGAEARDWLPWIEALQSAGRVRRDSDRYYATDGPTDPKDILLGRLEALGPVFDDHPLMLALQAEGRILRTRLQGRPAWCERRLLARIQRYTLDRLRQEIEPVTPAAFLRFLACWQHLPPPHRLAGPRGVLEVVHQLAGFEVPLAAWEKHILPARISDYRQEWLDEVTLSGEVAWGRLWGSAATAIRSTPVCLLPREALPCWLGLADAPDCTTLSGPAQEVLDALRGRGPSFPQELQRHCNLLPGHLEMGVAECVSRGLVTADSFGAVRQLITPPSRRRHRVRPIGRWSLFRDGPQPAPDPAFLAEQLLRRTGVVFRRTVTREKWTVRWFELLGVFRRMELRGEVRGGRFVAGVSGEQYALPEAVEQLRRIRRDNAHQPVSVVAADPLNFRGILTPEPRVPANTRQVVPVG